MTQIISTIIKAAKWKLFLKTVHQFGAYFKTFFLDVSFHVWLYSLSQFMHSVTLQSNSKESAVDSAFGLPRIVSMDNNFLRYFISFDKRSKFCTKIPAKCAFPCVGDLDIFALFSISKYTKRDTKLIRKFLFKKLKIEIEEHIMLELLLNGVIWLLTMKDFIMATG